MSEDTTGQPIASDSEASRPESDSEPVAGGLEEKVVKVLHKVYDPEIPVDIYELGLIYEIEISDGPRVTVKMTLTSPACPVAESLPLEVRAVIERIPEVTECEVDLVWEPQWSPDRMSEAAKLKLGML